MTFDEFDEFLHDNSVLDCESVAVCWYKLKKEIKLLRHLQEAGVDNWENYSDPEAIEDCE